MLSRCLSLIVAAAVAVSPAAAQDTPSPAVVEPAPASTVAPTASSSDPVPTDPDPLTPPTSDTGPARAPGAPAPTQQAKSVTEVDPAVADLRSRLASWPESQSGALKADLQALKDFYAEPDAMRVWTTPNGLAPRGDAVISALRRAAAWGLEADAFTLPTSPQPGALPETLIEAEIHIGLEVLKYARHARGGRLDPTTLSKMIDMRPRLYEPRSVLEAIAVAPEADAYLEGLHPRHKGFHALKGALASARAEAAAAPVGQGMPTRVADGARSSMERRILVNMERWRWLPDDLGAFHVWDNVPEQVTRVVHDGKAVHEARIVVGKPTTPTPMFSAPMRFVIFHPSWGVPEGIKANEIGPQLRRAQAGGSSGWFFSENNGASRVLGRHQLRVYSGGREVNPDSINWASVDVRRFSFTQPPSNRNVLGVVKFRFPNKFDVYMHDTSERHLFSRSSRTFSHGCMRVENPLKLAEVILAYDKGWGRERIAQLVARGTTTDVTLEKPVPVHIVYFTATVDQTGKLHTHSDIYGMDSRVASALAGRSVVLSSARSSEDAKPNAPAERKAERRNPPKREVKSAQKPSAGTPWNPFSPLSAN